MKSILLFILLSFSGVTFAHSSDIDPELKKLEDEASKAECQMDINLSAHKIAAYWDKKLNVIYKKILEDCKNDPITLKKIREAQRAWIAYRDASIATIAANPELRGSITPMEESLHNALLTKHRCIALAQNFYSSVNSKKIEKGIIDDKGK